MYWLQGCLEMREAAARADGGDGKAPMSADEVECIKRHLAMVFLHEIDPSMGGPEEQKKLDEAHAPKPPKGQHGNEHLRPPSSGGGREPVMRC